MPSPLLQLLLLLLPLLLLLLLQLLLLLLVPQWLAMPVESQVLVLANDPVCVSEAVSDD